ncbi:unnamed protein product [Ectocarpus sp. CCAP 1310/34]|nr:unnamed protein product [Ectocarpus sp. CCAP 1310/34]
MPRFPFNKRILLRKQDCSEVQLMAYEGSKQTCIFIFDVVITPLEISLADCKPNHYCK